MKKISFSILTAPELYTMGKRLLVIINGDSTNDPFVVPASQVLETSLNSLVAIMGRMPGSSYTNLLIDKDQSRDNAYIGLRDFVKANTNHEDPEITEAARRLYSIFEKNGLSFYSLGYATETSQLGVLFKDLSTETAQADLITIGALSWYERLKNKQDDFEGIYKQKIDDESAENLPLMVEEKKRASRYITGLLSYITIQSELSPETFVPLVEKINELISETMSIARARLSRKENDAEENNQQGTPGKIVA